MTRLLLRMTRRDCEGDERKRTKNEESGAEWRPVSCGSRVKSRENMPGLPTPLTVREPLEGPKKTPFLVASECLLARTRMVAALG